MAKNDEGGAPNEEDLEEFEAEQEEFAEEIRNLVLDYVEDNDVPEPTAVFTLIQLALSMHMSGYLGTVDKPSVAGLKLELDRFGNDLQEIIRDAKKNAGEFIEDFKTMQSAIDDED